MAILSSVNILRNITFIVLGILLVSEWSAKFLESRLNYDSKIMFYKVKKKDLQYIHMKKCYACKDASYNLTPQTLL